MKKKELIKLITEMRDFIMKERDAHDVEYGAEYGMEYSSFILKATGAIIEYQREKEKKIYTHTCDKGAFCDYAPLGE